MLEKSLWQRLRTAGGSFLRKLHVRESTIRAISAAVTVPPPPLYPLDIPAITIQPGLDFLLLELPPRYQPMMPNGIGYVHNVLLKTGVRLQTVDVNVLMYHRYHQARVLGKTPLVAPGGYVIKLDPWDNTNTAEWEREDVLDFFWPEIADLLQQIARNRVKAVGIAVHASNRVLAKRFVRELRTLAPEVVVVVGGYDCVYPHVGPVLFPDFDYMVIFEGEQTIGPLVSALARGQRPKDLPGVISRFDTPGRVWEPAPLLADLDSVDYPRYQWADMVLYQTFDRKHLVPITASRGCKWGRCRFCGERFPFRNRAPAKVADEIENMTRRGLHSFHFNESDVNGDPQALYDLCTEILRRGLKVQLVGQLRIHKGNTAEYFRHLCKAGFTYLRFGVDAWSENTIRLQRKGYTIPMVIQNLRDCRASGIFTAANLVLGVPGETEEDVDEMIRNIVACKRYIQSVESLNTLILTGGGDYLRNPDAYKIRFRGDKATILREHPYYVPPELWYSEDPYIDQEVRLQRLDRICAALHSGGVNIGAFASRVVEQLKATPAPAKAA